MAAGFGNDLKGRNMTTSTIVGLVNNTALLLALGLLYDILLFERPEEKLFVSKLTAGGFIGLLGIALMMTHWEFIPGLMFDSGMWTELAVIATSGGIGIAWQQFRRKKRTICPLGSP